MTKFLRWRDFHYFRIIWETFDGVEFDFSPSEIRKVIFLKGRFLIELKETAGMLGYEFISLYHELLRR